VDELPGPETTIDGDGTDAADATPAAPAPDADPSEVSPPGQPRRARLRLGRPHLPRSRRGLFALLLVLGGFGFAMTFAGVSILHWTETADFCGRCHSMAPELAAYEHGPHRDVACAECHVEPGVAGWIKSKINGTRQLIEVVLGTFPEPIPPPEHTQLPSSADTCQRCHTVEQHAVADVKTRTQFAEDEANTRQFVGLMVRPGGGDIFDVNRSVHWHVLRDVQYASDTPNGATIDYVRATGEDGQVKEFIAQDKIRDAQAVQPDVDAVKASDTLTKMTCYDCHNRAGHDIPNPRTGLDYDLSTGAIDATLPFIKREGMRILTAEYPDVATADAAADGLRDFYRDSYPDVATTKAAAIDDAIARLKVLYRDTATPEMKVTAKTYPDNLGHTDFPGCFRCHDGGHYLVKDGVATKQAIPSTCDTCHTFPQIGLVASLPLGTPPTTHDDKLWVFDHKNVAKNVDPGGQTCGQCHARDYCVNCHATGAVTVDHDEMATNHAKVIREQGNTACAYCHQPVYCARCHAEPVLPITTPFLNGLHSDPEVPLGLAWPLHPRT
jgi:nitrate/TMAO reductase-like tetraheme cytochrome c subunit